MITIVAVDEKVWMANQEASEYSQTTTLGETTVLMSKTITKSLYTRIRIAIVDYREQSLNIEDERIWFSIMRVEF